MGPAEGDFPLLDASVGHPHSRRGRAVRRKWLLGKRFRHGCRLRKSPPGWGRQEGSRRNSTQQGNRMRRHLRKTRLPEMASQAQRHLVAPTGSSRGHLPESLRQLQLPGQGCHADRRCRTDRREIAPSPPSTRRACRPRRSGGVVLRMLCACDSSCCQAWSKRRAGSSEYGEFDSRTLVSWLDIGIKNGAGCPSIQSLDSREPDSIAATKLGVGMNNTFRTACSKGSH